MRHTLTQIIESLETELSIMRDWCVSMGVDPDANETVADIELELSLYRSERDPAPSCYGS